MVKNGATRDSQTAQNSDNEFVKNCPTQDKIGKDYCIFSNISWKVFYDQVAPDIKNCELISEKSPERSHCYWVYAMRAKDPSLCEKINDNFSQNSAGPSYGFLSKSNCKKELHYTAQDSDWRLEAGFPPYSDPVVLVYSGKAKLDGWLIEGGAKGEKNPDPYFHIADKDLQKLPFSMQKNQEYLLKVYSKENKFEKVPQKTIDRLKKFSEKIPATITVDKIEAFTEGSPILTIVDGK